MTYVDGFVLPVPKKNLPAYRRMAEAAGKVWREHGALEVPRVRRRGRKSGKAPRPFPKASSSSRARRWLSPWIVFKSRAHRDKVNAKVMKDPRLAGMMNPKDHALRRQAPDLWWVRRCWSRPSGFVSGRDHQGAHVSEAIMIEIVGVIAGVTCRPRRHRLLIYAATKPDTFRVQRTASIKAPPEKIFALINDFDNWVSWSPYEKKDPAMKRTCSGAAKRQGRRLRLGRQQERRQGPHGDRGSIAAFHGHDQTRLREAD